MVRLIRYYKGEDCTMGVLLVDGLMLHTMENPWKDNERNVSCIPCGTYEVRPFSGAKYHEVWQLLDVENRDYILIHAGNTTHDTQGCILPGKSTGSFSVDGEICKAVLHSKAALKELSAHVGHNFILKIEEV